MLWEGVAYSPPNVTELLSDASVKRHYVEAIRVVHPDKLAGDSNEPLARAIFGELNDAWRKFKDERS